MVIPRARLGGGAAPGRGKARVRQERRGQKQAFGRNGEIGRRGILLLGRGTLLTIEPFFEGQQATERKQVEDGERYRDAPVIHRDGGSDHTRIPDAVSYTHL